MWATAGIGMAIGGGMYVVGLLSTAIILFVQIILHTNSRFTKHARAKRIKYYGVTEQGFQDKITKIFAEHDISISDVAVEKKVDTEGLNYSFYIEIFSNINEEKIISLTDYPCSIEG